MPVDRTSTRILTPLRSALAHAATFSVFVNLMLLGPTLFMLQVFDRVLSSRSTATLGMLSIGVVIALLAMSVVDIARSRLLVETGRHIDEHLGEAVLRGMVRMASTSAGRASASLRDVATLRGFLSGPNVIALFDAPWMFIYLIVIYLFHPMLGALALIGSLLLIVLAWYIERANRLALEQLAEATRRDSQHVQQGLRNADVLNGMGMTDAFASVWSLLHRQTLDLMQASSSRGGAMLAVSKFLRQAIQVAMMAAGAWLVLDSHVSPGVMMAATILFGRAMAPVEALIGNWSGLVGARAAYRRLKAMPELSPTAVERTPLPAPVGHLKLERIALAGQSADSPILRQVDFELAAGQSMGILGPSGAGKSSLAKVLVGVLPPSAGKLRIDGADIAQWDPRQLGPQIGYLPQDVELFAGTVAANIARFQAGAGEEVTEAARRAHAFEMILKLPQGFDTLIGEGGIHLSAGQAQRIGLARALFRRPRIVVLDEPNSNLDAEGEQALLETLLTLKQERTTVLMITHKAALVAGLDELLVLREGRVELMGPRETVLARLAGPAGPALAPVRKGAP